MEGSGNRIAAILVLTLSFLTCIVLSEDASDAQPQVPCCFVFGDSLVDNGNNNDLPTLARSNYRPYGIDFPEGPSGRFTNGRTVVDILVQFLGLKGFIRSYASARRSNTLGVLFSTPGVAGTSGLNYASAAAGIRQETGKHLGANYYLADQVRQFNSTGQSLRGSFGNDTELNIYLSKCLYGVSMGSNDYLNNYFLPNIYRTSQQYTPSAFAEVLVQEFSGQLLKLYDLGARKFAVFGLGLIGCIPFELARMNNTNKSTCNEDQNKAIELFNTRILQLVKRFNTDLPGARFVYGNIYDPFRDLLLNAAAYGFTVTNKSCCGVGPNNGLITCLPNQTPCQNRTTYLFWDSFHPTEALNMFFAIKSYNSTSPSDIYPENIQQLATA
ncbi:hypothetical protein LUZ63_004000 [Rhynchospora breviuscula]|uniref:Uncharacterized protein n=1 Tax=Rhynchospora breviuscula TaxID=2022672 RepID=A0A9Q0D1N2_9POAL|nr:hypothetical protein LUZ63_004000 [Rhynchospora breviuscula]